MTESNHDKESILDRLKGLLSREWFILLLAAPVFFVVWRLVFKIFASESFPMHYSLGKIIPIIFIAALGYWLMQKGPELLPRFAMADFLPGLGAVGLSAGLVLLIHFLKPMQFVDDAGFILRYLDNVESGCFYCFNVADGPVFGVSSFLYGLGGIILVGSGIFSPEGALTFMTYLGLFFSSLLLLAILKKLVNRPAFSFLLWLFVMAMSRAFLDVSNSGMESVFHLAVCLGAIWFFLDRKNWAMWSFLALATISKLSAVPLVLVVAAMWFWENRKDLRPISTSNGLWRPIILAAVLPVLAYIILTILLFGSPLPQSAYAKMYLHAHAEGSWFPFMDYFSESFLRSILFALFLLTFLGQVAWGLFNRDHQAIRESVFGFAALGILVLYYFFNPGERMIWYYVLPDILMLIQVAVVLGKVFSLLPGVISLYSFLGIIGLWFVFTATHVKIGAQWFHRYVQTVEVERLQIGQAVANYTSPTDSLLSGHGLTSRLSPAYVIDRTGLNSRLALEYELDFEKIMASLKPGWLILHGWDYVISRINRDNYRLVDSWYDITLYNYPTWRLFERVGKDQSQELIRIKPSEVGGKRLEVSKKGEIRRIIGEEYQFQFPKGRPGEQFLQFGIYKKDKEFSLKITEYQGDSLLRSFNKPVPAYLEGMGYQSRTVKVNIPVSIDSDATEARKIIVRREGIEDLVEIVDPAYVLKKGK